ncbi:putative membrane protein [Salinibacterium sp. CAN_S4]|uniref:DUF2273 domain-containing protein n=1 Tax=Salinibacterium sp. CAN_S4 TaxID=2787727 RepID=UPI0018EFCB95
MTGTVVGAAAGFLLAVTALLFGFWGFLLALVLAAVGAIIGAVVSGRLDLRAVTEAARGRRSA